jgi:hypothetical protein
MQLTAIIRSASCSNGLTYKIIRVMKLTAVFLLTAALQVSARSDGQRVTLTGKNVPLEKVFKEIRKQTGYNFLYNDAWLGQTKNVSLEVTKAPLTEVLNICFQDQPFTYSIVEQTIVVKQKQFLAIQPENTNSPVSIPPITVRGRVVNDAGEPVRATVAVKGVSNAATSTNDNGEFTIEVQDPNSSLVISAVGIETLEIKINGRTELTVNAKTKVSVMDEMQIIAYGTTTRRLSTSSISKIKGEEIRKQPVENHTSQWHGRRPCKYKCSWQKLAGSRNRTSLYY